jgi:hypothetical protein
VAFFDPQPHPAFDTAPRIALVEDEVIVGPGALAFSMTRVAAEETHRRLGEVLFGPQEDARRAEGQPPGSSFER